MTPRDAYLDDWIYLGGVESIRSLETENSNAIDLNFTVISKTHLSPVPSYTR